MRFDSLDKSSSDISARRQELFDQLLRQEGLERPAQLSIPRLHAQHAPLSFAQQRLWFLQQFEPDHAAYNIPVALRFLGALEPGVLERVIDGIVARHEVLRTTFSMEGGRPMQTVHPPAPLKLLIINLEEIPAATRHEEARRLAKEETCEPFDLIRSVIRTKLLRLSPEEHVLLLTLHHIAADAWSVDVLMRELSQLYEAYFRGKVSPLPELPIQYADYALWQRERIQGALLKKELECWKKQLAGISALELPTVRPHPAIRSHAGACHHFVVSSDLFQGLREIGGQEDATPFMTLLAVFTVLLHRYTGQKDIPVGTPISGRNRSELEGLIGLFLNTLVLRIDLTGNWRFGDLLRHVREVTLEAYAHQELPFEQLVEEMQPERNLGQTPLFQSMFIFQHETQRNWKFCEVDIQMEDVDNATSKFDLTLFFNEHGQGLQGKIEYNTDVFDDVAIKQMADHLHSLLEGIVRNPERGIKDLPLLSGAERRQILERWNETQAEWPRSQTLHSLVEAQVVRTPAVEAVVFQLSSMTYTEMNRRANQLAHFLNKRGIRPEVRVGICMEPALEMLVGILGILKAGGTYVPLDPAYPAERLAYMVDDAGVRILLSCGKLNAILPSHRVEVIRLDDDWHSIEQESDINPAETVVASNLAYIIYTSGSTGRPKGVMICHSHAVAMLAWASRHYPVNQVDSVLGSTSICFDLSVFEFFVPLVQGGRLVLTNDLHLWDASWQGRVELVNTVPSLLDEWLNCHSIPLSLKRVNLAGEKLSSTLVANLFRLRPDLEIFNLYGPSECTTYSSISQVRAGEPIMIGQPIANTRIYVLDEELRPVPVNVAGELCIGGAGVARGYLNRPELTAERFVPDPFSREGGERLYRTGDQARWRANGNLEFLGRLDEQVKIRGHRIELGEIEVVLREQYSVNQAVVVARPDHRGDHKLIAYIVEEPGRELSIPDLRTLLKQKLPAYMVPSSFVRLEKLPLSPTGKVDRRSLAVLEELEAPTSYVEPRTPTERMLSGIFEDVLRLDCVGVEDDFFDRGGHSLLAIQVIARVRNKFHLEIPVRTFFDQPKISALASIIDENRDSRTLLQAPKIAAIPRNRLLPVSPGEEVLWVWGQISPNYLALHMPLCRRFKGVLNVTALEKSVNEIIRRHEVLRTTFITKGISKHLLPLFVRAARSAAYGAPAKNRRLQRWVDRLKRRIQATRLLAAVSNKLVRLGWAVSGHPSRMIVPSLTIPLTIVDLQHLPASERDQMADCLATEEVNSRFDLAKGPLIRMKLLKLADEDQVFLLTLHHIVCDAWSLELLARELQRCYGAYSTGRTPDLTSLPIQYADYAVWRREQMEGEAFKNLVEFWKERLKDLPQLLPLPVDRPRPPEPSLPSASVTFQISRDQTRGLKGLSRQGGTTIFMTLLAVFVLLLYRLSGLEDMVVAAPVAERGHSELETIVGFFMGIVVIRIDLSGDPTFQELLRRVREASQDSYAHQDSTAIVEALVQEVGIQEYARLRGSMFKTLFNWVSVPTCDLDLPGLRSEPFISKLVNPELGPDIMLQGRERDEAIDFLVIYKEPLFSVARMKEFTKQFSILVSQITEANYPISEYSLSDHVV